MPNRLAGEQSPYLLQHANNPVDWYPWGDQAFAAARKSDKAIFLSIGYATCHWCHVMERESFESVGVANVLNEHFISIKVDREERPDVDRVYMTFVQATTGSGGWPMSVWLTPELKPFYGGTYFPPTSQWGRPAFVDVLAQIAKAWREDRARVTQSAAEVVARLAVIARVDAARTMPGEEALASTLQQFQQSFDARRGGFGDAPKFPRPSELIFLLRESARTGEAAGRDMVVQTLRSMALGGMRDHIGGGFHRYSVDGNWRVPHFEKMLYDQAQLAVAYLEAAQAANDPFFAQVAEDTLQYVQRDMTDDGGGFYSAEDADSVPPDQVADPHAATSAEATVPKHKMEGAFYVWGLDEVRAALGEDSAIFEGRYGLLPNGNAPFDPQQEFVDNNLLHTAQSLADLAQAAGVSAVDVAESLLRSRKILFEVRETRPRPLLDDKVLTAWNGLMIGAFARAARVLAGGEALGHEPGEADPGARHLQSATRAAAFIRERVWNPSTKRLLRRYRQGDAAIDGYAEDYAFLIFGLIELFQASGDPSWLSWARELQTQQDELFWDAAGGGWFSTTGQDPTVLLRLKEDYDGAEPSPSSVSALNLLALAHLTGDAAYSDRAAEAIASFGARLEQLGRAVPLMAAALSTALSGGEQIVVVGDRGAADTTALWQAAHRRFRPFTVSVIVDPKQQDAVAAHMPWVAAMKMIDGRATAYVCRNFACDAPSTDPGVFG
ncbi:MAG: thioredoxin domain-containing protein [Acidobacteriota bacterium]|nr:thioredoxin domain-containing protein [Acidobacteriota bacterium]